ncbi:hypothetical protein Ate01nite_57260 [Actinoplanes teichomyceticus]|nr:hypothetical protein Ate01nite_57260 [Actinoplanes teichomyceticus]
MRGSTHVADATARAAREVVVSKKVDQDQLQAAAREAKEHGMSASEAGVSQGAAKQIDHHTHRERAEEDTPRGGKS